MEACLISSTNEEACHTVDLIDHRLRRVVADVVQVDGDPLRIGGMIGVFKDTGVELCVGNRVIGG